MSTGYSWEGIRQVRATLLGARHVPERLCGGGHVYLGRYIKCSTFTFFKLENAYRAINELIATNWTLVTSKQNDPGPFCVYYLMSRSSNSKLLLMSRKRRRTETCYIQRTTVEWFGQLSRQGYI